MYNGSVLDRLQNVLTTVVIRMLPATCNTMFFVIVDKSSSMSVWSLTVNFWTIKTHSWREQLFGMHGFFWVHNRSRLSLCADNWSVDHFIGMHTLYSSLHLQVPVCTPGMWSPNIWIHNILTTLSLVWSSQMLWVVWLLLVILVCCYLSGAWGNPPAIICIADCCSDRVVLFRNRRKS